MKYQANRVTINEFPHIYCNEPYQDYHAIVTEDEYGDNFFLHLFLNGVTYHFNVNTLSQNDFEAHNCTQLTLTHSDLTWGPSTTIYEDQENDMLNYNDNIFRPDFTLRGTSMVINYLCM